ncbi:MAG: class I SAM-dependent methyltransferase [candidate division Zixibacteria bacterium]|nr:class I SAM-dependent methyltransferase [candidate division Zixibacteria bacterium]MDH3935881.1 class I SAM-dependent methyltransferase [candidate division Zixibacteria bacterium]MDH4034287.1 class I SAM-dependent methyltransferase [candidate division Zixibacteria bacterium]
MNKPDQPNHNDPELLNYYSARAPEYEQIYYRDVPQRQMELAAEVSRLRRLVQGCSVLDIACGTGYWLEKMSQTAEQIAAVDISREMIEQARQKETACPVDFVRGDIYDLPFNSDLFDRVTLGFWFSHHPRQQYDDLFNTLLAYMKENGSIWMIDNNPPAEGLRHNSVGSDRHGNNLIKRRLDSGREYTIIKNYFDAGQLESIFGNRFRVEQLIYGDCYWSVVLKDQG